jgi:oligopeptide/dipeptide ABC transporter ATP-binding protein
VILEVKNLSVNYQQKDKTATALHNVSFALERGEILGVVGESGCGKTTLMLALLRLLPQAGRISSGQVLYEGKDILKLDDKAMAELRWDEISIVFQGAMNALNPVRTVGEQIAEAIRRHEKDTSKVFVNGRVNELLELVGIAKNRRDQYPHQYSGGMRQRAMMAMALACYPKIIIADEPTTALDVMIQAQILELLIDLRDKLGLAVILVTHDLGVVAELCDSVLVLYAGVTAEYADVDTLFNSPQHPYTQRLLAAFPNLENPKALESIPGYPPRLDNLPQGCRFAPRCHKAFERCETELPRLYQVNAWQYSSCFLSERLVH